jgi:hypothetical protein
MAMERLFRHRQTKEAETDKLILKRFKPVLYSTINIFTVCHWNPHKRNADSRQGKGYLYLLRSPAECASDRSEARNLNNH